MTERDPKLPDQFGRIVGPDPALGVVRASQFEAAVSTDDELVLDGAVGRSGGVEHTFLLGGRDHE